MTQMQFRPWMMTVGIGVMAAFFLVGCATPYGGAMVSENPVTVAPPPMPVSPTRNPMTNPASIGTSKLVIAPSRRDRSRLAAVPQVAPRIVSAAVSRSARLRRLLGGG